MTEAPSCSTAAPNPPIPLPAPFLQHCQEAEGRTATELLTTDSARWPHVAHLSAGEIVVDSDGYVRLTLWSVSQATRNLLDERQAVLLDTSPEGVFEIRCAVEPLRDLPGFDHLRAFRLTPLSVRDKRAPYADIINGVRFRLHNAREVHARWRQVRTLLQAAAIAR